MKQNPHQVRAAHALQSSAKVRSGEDEGDAISGYPAIILRSGLMQALAFSLETKNEGTPKRDEYKRIADAISLHLSSTPNGENLVAPQPASGKGLLEKLSQSDSAHLRRCTSEALEYLSYLKRFSR